MKYRALLFDFDGTLVDSMHTYASVMLRILDENNVKYPDDIIKIITPLGYIGTARYFREVLGCERTEKELYAKMGEYMIDEYTNRIGAKPHVINVLRELKSEGISLNVLTASPHVTLDPCLRRLGIFDIFDNVWSCSDFDTTKADPLIYKMAAQRMGVPVCSVLFLDDNPDADRTAKSAGMPVCGVYDDSSAEYEADMRRVCDFYIKDFSELRANLQ